MTLTRLESVLLLCAVAGSARATDVRPFEDAPLAATQFVDKQEGWAAGADGVIWHTIDGGKHWERQPTGVRANLQSIHFLNPYTGWIVGREELPNAGGSVGVILFTDDGGLRWTRLSTPPLSGLNCIRFFDDKTGLVAGDGTDLYPSGVFATRDGGRTWHPAPGPRCPTWLACDFRDPETGVLAGAWGRLGTIRDGVFNSADVDKLGGRDVRAVHIQGRRGVAAGQNGLVLLSQDSAGDRWGFADLRLPPEVAAGCDFNAVALVDQHIWIAGRPGSVVFHSPDFGRSWEVQPTGQSAPLHALHFTDARTGWAVGDLGAVLGTTDGGKTWTIQRRGGQRAAVLFVHARPDGAALETVAALGADDGYLTAAVRVTAADPATADVRHAADAARWLAAQRRAGGAAGECLSFPLPQHLAAADRTELAAAWERMPTSRGEQLVCQLTMLIRAWQPEVVVTDFAGAAPETLAVDAVRAAFNRAADPQSFPGQLQVLRLQPWQAKKLYGAWDGPGVSPVIIQDADGHGGLTAAARLRAESAFAILTPPVIDQRVTAQMPARRCYRLLASTIAGADGHSELMAGITLAAGGAARRPPAVEDVDPDRRAEAERAVRERRTLDALSQPDWGKLADSGALLSQIGPILSKLPPEQAANAAFAVASRYAQAGQWHMAREAFLLMADRYPANPLAADAYRWLVAFHSSGEARRREELGQFLILATTDIHSAAHVTTHDDPVRAGVRADIRDLNEATKREKVTLLSDPAAYANGGAGLSRSGARKWYEAALAIEPRLAAVGAQQSDDPAVQFCLQASRRQLGDVETPRQWYRHFVAARSANAVPASKSGDDPWRDAAAAELWLTERVGPPPKPLLYCKHTAVKPYLDGKLDDPCWADAAPVVLRDAGAETAAACPTRARLACDDEYLYVAIECKRPPGPVVARVEKRTRDADLRGHDRIGIMLDLDRDYQTYFHFEIDERGAVAEDCWGDRSWNPTWYAASTATPDGWTAEVAIPLKELTDAAPTIGRAWAVNIVRVLPGRGVQAWSLPADVRPRPEGMGLLLFADDPQSKP